MPKTLRKNNFVSKEDLKKELEDIEKLLSDSKFVLDYKKVAQASMRYAEIQRILESGDSENASSGSNKIIVEIRAGTGGNEAALFAGSLFEMYRKFSELNAWSVEVLDSNQTQLGGYKQITFQINGKNSYGSMKYESGVHRVQRIPETEKSGRVHTSTATVAVLLQAKPSEVEIKPEDLEISFFRSSGPGGQNVNKVSTAVRIIHKPSGCVVSSQKERSQPRNKELALEILRAKLYDLRQREDAGKLGEERKKQIGTGDRSEKIRTYNFPQDRITDHRIKKSWGNIEKILEGNMNDIIDALHAYEKEI